MIKQLKVTIELGLVFIMATLDTNMVPAGRDFKLPFICWVVLINHVTLLETFFVILFFHRVNRDQIPPFWLTKICRVESVAKIIKPDLVKIQPSGKELFVLKIVILYAHWSAKRLRFDKFHNCWSRNHFEPNKMGKNWKEMRGPNLQKSGILDQSWVRNLYRPAMNSWGP